MGAYCCSHIFSCVDLGRSEWSVARHSQQHHVWPSSDGPLGSGPRVWGVWYHVSSGRGAVCCCLQGNHGAQDQRCCARVRNNPWHILEDKLIGVCMKNTLVMTAHVVIWKIISYKHQRWALILIYSYMHSYSNTFTFHYFPLVFLSFHRNAQISNQCSILCCTYGHIVSATSWQFLFPLRLQNKKKRAIRRGLMWYGTLLHCDCSTVYAVKGLFVLPPTDLSGILYCILLFYYSVSSWGSSLWVVQYFM